MTCSADSLPMAAGVSSRPELDAAAKGLLPLKVRELVVVLLGSGLVG